MSTPLFPTALLQALRPVAATLHRHHRRLAGSVLVLLGGAAVTAFAIAPLAPDAADLPTRLVSEELAMPGLAEQVEALADAPLDLWRTEQVRAGDTADTLLRRLGLQDADAARQLRLEPDARALFDGRAGKLVQVRSSADGQLAELVARFAPLDAALANTHFQRFTLLRSAGGRWTTRLDTVPLTAQPRIAVGTIRTNIWAATDDARLPDAVSNQLVEVFAGDIDFHRQLRRGDSFRVIYETLTADDQPVTWAGANGRILAAEIISRGQPHQALWFADGQGRGAYFSFDGRSRARAFLASPLQYTRLTSGFEMRQHPILNDWRAHNGVDYSAPTGTPVFSVGDGHVEFAGRQRGYGNVVEVRHDSRQTTVYAHLSSIAVANGQRIRQGQALGQVGATGYATGPHLHFEFRVNGQFEDPLQLAATRSTATLDASNRARFEQRVALARGQMAAMRDLGNARTSLE